MLGAMKRVLASGLLVGVLAPPAGAEPRVHGKVVRVERTRGPAVAPRICDLGPNHEGICLGGAPIVGDLVTVLAEHGVLGDARITEIQPFAPGGASACASLWNVKTELVRGDLSSAPGRTLGLVDPTVHPRKGRLLARDRYPAPPSGRRDDQVVLAVDRDGDDTADLVMTQSSCEATSAGPAGACVDAWARVRGRLVHVQHTNFAACSF